MDVTLTVPAPPTDPAELAAWEQRLAGATAMQRILVRDLVLWADLMKLNKPVTSGEAVLDMLVLRLRTLPMSLPLKAAGEEP